MVHIFIRVCALIYNCVLPSIFAHYFSNQYLLQTAEVIPHLRLDVVATKRRRKCTAQIARAAWHMDGTSALTSANRRSPGVPERACRTDATLGRLPEHGPGVRFGAVHAAVFSSGRFHSSIMSRRMYK